MGRTQKICHLYFSFKGITCGLAKWKVWCVTFLTICLIFIPRPKSRSASSIILRGANDFMLDEMERSLHDAICVVKRVLESKTVVPGGGAVEAALSIYLENFATSLVRKTFCTLLGLISTFFFTSYCSEKWACIHLDLQSSRNRT